MSFAKRSLPRGPRIRATPVTSARQRLGHDGNAPRVSVSGSWHTSEKERGREREREREAVSK